MVDGKVVDEIESLDPKDIEKISVIKDDSKVVKKYNAKNGVIMITTKKKKEKKIEQIKKIDDDTPIFFIVEEMPSFPGGKPALKGYLNENLVYPKKAKSKGISGEVYVKFVVSAKGVVKDIEVEKSSDSIFEEAAMDVFRDMPVWKPGKQRGKPLNVQVNVPVRFDVGQE